MKTWSLCLIVLLLFIVGCDEDKNIVADKDQDSNYLFLDFDKETEQVEINKAVLEQNSFIANFPCGEYKVEVEGRDVHIEPDDAGDIWISQDYIFYQDTEYADLSFFVRKSEQEGYESYEVIGETPNYKYKLSDDNFEIKDYERDFSDFEKMFESINLDKDEVKLNENLLIQGIHELPIDKGEKFVVNLPCKDYLVEVKDTFSVGVTGQQSWSIEAGNENIEVDIEAVSESDDAGAQPSMELPPTYNIEIETKEYLYEIKYDEIEGEGSISRN